MRWLAKIFNPYDDVEKHRRDDAIRNDFIDLFATTRGRRVLAHIVNMGNVFSTTGMLLDATRRRVDVNDGRRQLALEIFDLSGGARDRLSTAVVNDKFEEAYPHERYPRQQRPEPVSVINSGDDADDVVIIASGDE
jgi:hypothetical protein